MDIALYGDDSKGAIRLDPRTKLLVFFASGILSFAFHHALFLAIYGAVLCALLALCGRKALAFGGYALLLAGLYVRYCANAQSGTSNFAASTATSLIAIMLFGLPPVMSFCLLSQTTRISQFMAAFAAMRLPTRIVIPIAVLFRFIPSVADEWNGIRKAMAFRGISLQPAAVVKSPFKTIEYVLIPLLFSSISVMEEMAAATLARGIDSESRRSSYAEARLRAADYTVMAVFALLAAYMASLGRAGAGI
ncbi:MAG: energy-coupling factor transporter transmembrane protein EcfT [Clostridiales bacterium]|jgi:energy-coupling factor transport system permease protein|nr:energy-coupling factor transporter transmembrane protein EcfT [Clostridiales bacterium]